MRAILKLIKDERGVGSIEYAMIASLIAIAAISGIATLGDKVDQKYSEVDTAVDDAM
jgi:Flp pilus assembly pilin Flp